MDTNCCLKEQIDTEVGDSLLSGHNSKQKTTAPGMILEEFSGFDEDSVLPEIASALQAKTPSRAKAKKSPAARFERGVCIARERSEPGFPQGITKLWYVVGRLAAGTPFLLMYAGSGMTNWTCDERLGEPLRRGILDLFRKEIRRADPPPACIAVYDLSKEPSDRVYNAQSAAIIESFYRDVWRGEYMHNLDQDVSLDVPFAEMDLAKAAGARWDPGAQTWKAKRQANMSPFARWLKAEPELARAAPNESQTQYPEKYLPTKK